MIIIHPDTRKPCAIAHMGTLPENFRGELRNIAGSPSDGYSAQVVAVDGSLAGSAVNFMDGQGWFCS